MKKLSPLAESRMTDAIQAALKSCGEGTDPSEAVAKLAMDGNMSTEEAARVCEAVNKIASIYHLSSDKGDRGGNFPLANSSAVKKIMKDSLKVAAEPFRFRKTINAPLPNNKQSFKEAKERIWQPTKEEQEWLDNNTKRMEVLGQWEELQGRTEFIKKANEEARLGVVAIAEEFGKLATKVANADKRTVDDMARYAVYTYGNDGINFLTALENLSGVPMDKTRRPFMKVGNDLEASVDRIIALTDCTKAIKVAATLTAGNKSFTINPMGSPDISDPTTGKENKAEVIAQRNNAERAIEQAIAEDAESSGDNSLTVEQKLLNDRVKSSIESATQLSNAQFDQGQQQTKQNTEASKNRYAESDANFRESWQPTDQSTEANRKQYENTESGNRLAGQGAVEAARTNGKLLDVGTAAVKQQEVADADLQDKLDKAQALSTFKNTRENDLQRMEKEYKRREADREWMEKDRKAKAVAEALRRGQEQGDKTSKALQELASSTLANTKGALGLGVGILKNADMIRQALTPEQRSGNASARPLSNEATKYLENLRLHDVFAKTYLSDPYLHQYSPAEVAEAFNIVYEVAPQLVKNGSNPHIIGALIRKYLANTNQLDPLEIRDLTSTEKDRVDTELKKEQLEAIRRGKATK